MQDHHEESPGYQHINGVNIFVYSRKKLIVCPDAISEAYKNNVQIKIFRFKNSPIT